MKLKIRHDTDVDAYADADTMSPNSITRSFIRRNVPSSRGRSFFTICDDIFCKGSIMVA